MPVETSQVDANPVHWVQAITSVPVRAMSPPYPQPGQAPLQQFATFDMPSGSRTDTGVTGWVASSSDGPGAKWPLKGPNDPWLGIGDADAIEPNADIGLGDGGGGPMDVIETYATRSPGADLEDM